VDANGLIDDKEDSGKKYVQKIANLFPDSKSMRFDSGR